MVVSLLVGVLNLLLVLFGFLCLVMMLCSVVKVV